MTSIGFLGWVKRAPFSHTCLFYTAWVSELGVWDLRVHGTALDFDLEEKMSWRAIARPCSEVLRLKHCPAMSRFHGVNGVALSSRASVVLMGLGVPAVLSLGLYSAWLYMSGSGYTASTTSSRLYPKTSGEGCGPQKTHTQSPGAPRPTMAWTSLQARVRLHVDSVRSSLDSTYLRLSAWFPSKVMRR